MYPPRRRLLLSVAGVTLGAAQGRLHAHTPYRQWVVYRQKHLLIGCHRDDPSSYALAKGTVAMLDHALPDARSRVARGPAASRLASLLATEQLDVAIVEQATADAMRHGRDGFAAYGPLPLSTLYRFGRHRLVAHARLDSRHAERLVEALDSMRHADAPHAHTHRP